ncbi:MAG TPA: TadE/TadG family type IV pilus assembly protein [Bryobacteraceae bacterium]|nr:TadE/TadG family type IV pilus assembly protein [Bryobacteraceae bacterium]
MLRSYMGNRRRGSAMLEGALVALAFLAVLIGIFDVGQILLVRQTFVARVRSAVRYGAVHPDDIPGIRNIVLYGQTTTPAGSPPGILGLTPSMVMVSRNDAGTNEDRIVVSIVNYPYRLFSPWIAGPLAAAPVTATHPVEAP